MTPADTDRLRSFGRTGGRPLSPRRQGLMETLLPRLSVPETGAAGLKPMQLFARAQEVWLEIGFGGGEHLLGQAEAHPEVGLIGCEPFDDGMAKALAGIEARQLENVRLHHGDGRAVLDRLADRSLARIYLLFPDPWPKRRHWKRRIVQPAFTAELARVLKPGGEVRFATDVASYADEALLAFRQTPGLTWTAARAADWRDAPADHVTTRYQSKRLGDCAPVFYAFVKSA